MERQIHGVTEYIEAIATVGRHFKPNFLIIVTPDTNREGICYFKYLDSEKYTTAEHIARINIRKTERIFHKDATGKKEWDLSHKDKKALCDYLQSESKFKGVTNWQMLLYHWNNENGFLEEGLEEESHYNSPVEAFVDGFYDTEENLSNPTYVASILEMPNYMEL